MLTITPRDATLLEVQLCYGFAQFVNKHIFENGVFEECICLPGSDVVVVVCWFLNVPATCECVSGTDQLRQLYVLVH